MRTAVTPTARRAIGLPPPTGRQIGEVISRPAPTGGWNTRDSLAQMPPLDAVALDNFFPDKGRVLLRKGHTSHATGVGSGDVEMIAGYHAGTTRTLLAAGGGAIYDATASGAATSKASGFSSNRWQTASMNAKMGFVNGTDAPQDYDGTNVAAMTISGSGLTVANLIGINIFKSRSYFWKNNDQDFWYSAVNALGGTLTNFPLNKVGTFGGNLIAMASWTLDGGDGVDDLAVFIMSSGEVIVYQGSNPGDASAWALIGVFHVGSPLGVRAIVKFGGDLLITTKDGYVPLGRVLQLGRIANVGAISDKIAPSVVKAVDDFAGNFGWQTILYPRGNRIIFNVPVSATTYHQHVVNTVTGAWCRFTGTNGRSWGLHNDRLYFGDGAGVVMLADDGNADNSTDILGDAETAFDYMGAPGQQKDVTALSPVLAAGGSVNFGLQAQADFKSDTIANDTYNFSSSIGGEDNWETVTANWEDSTIVFQSASADIVRDWISATANGYAINSHLAVATQNAFEWYAINYLVRIGGLV